jgi:copper chaperone CopZ
MTQLKLKVAGMTCGHCKMKVEKALQGVAGTFGASVFLDDGEAEVQFDPARAGADQYLDAVRRAGYQAAVSE